MSQPQPGPPPYVHYGPPPQQKKRRVWLWVLLGVMALFVLMFAGCAALIGGSSPATPKATGAPCAPAYLDKQPSDLCADGSGAVTIDGLAVSAGPLAKGDNGIGGTSLCSDVTIRNTGSASKDYNVFDFKVQSPTGDVGTGSASGIGSTLNSGALVAGGTKTGKVCQDSTGPVQRGQWVLIYKPNPFLDQRGIWLASI